MGTCPRCGAYNGMQGNGLCSTCAMIKGGTATADRNREIKNERDLNQHEREARAAEERRRAALTPEERRTEDRQIRRKLFKPVRTVILIVLIAAVIVGMFFAIDYITNLITGSSTVYEAVYVKLLEKYENHPSIMTDVETTPEPGLHVINEMKADLADSDYYLRLFTEGAAEIQKYTLGEQARYYFKFSSGYGDLSDRKFAIANGLIYEIGKENKVYYESSDAYETLLEKLNAYLPENCLGRGPFTSESRLDSAEDNISAMIAYGENITALYDVSEGYYFEKTETLFARLEYNYGSNNDSMFNLPKTADCTEIK